MSDAPREDILVRVQPIGPTGRQVNRFDPAEALGARSADIKRGIAAAASVVADSIEAVRPADGWSVDSIDAKFGITLGTEGSVIVSTVSAEASFEITVSFHRKVDSTARPEPR